MNTLDASEAQYRCLADALPHIVWTAAASGHFDYCNGRWFDYTGLSGAESVDAGWQTVVYPGDLERLLGAWSDAVARGTTFEIECRLKRADGSYRQHLARALPFRNASGDVVKWFGSCTDIDDCKRLTESASRFTEQLQLNEREISARKRAEAALRASGELFRQVEEHAPVGLALLALDGSFIRVNPALCALTGYSKDELMSMHYESLFRAADRDANATDMQQMLGGSVADTEREIRSIHKDGQAVWSLVNASLVRDEAGEALYFIAQMQDIAARKFVEEAVRKAQAAALSSTEAKSRFLATMSHELRTPMNGIIGMLELLSLSALDEEQSECVTVVRESSRSLLRVLNDILDFSKIEAGKLNLERVNFDLAVQVGSVVSLLCPQARAKGVTLTTQLDDEVAVTLKGDPGRIRQILINLVGNALKFTPAGGSVGIFGVAERNAGVVSAVRFTIVDSGIGIAADVAARLFQPFSQLDDSTTRRYGGTGLGLAICKQLVDLMGGRIGIDSSAEYGSRFWFTFPFLRGDDDAVHAIEPPAQAEPERRAVARPRSQKLLLAEDNEVNALLAIKQFKRLGFEVTVVANGREAVAAVRSDRFDIVFMDCHMPVMDGFEATRAIRKLATGARIPIVAMTANAQAEDRRHCLAAGMDDYISKPSSLSDLHAMLERWLPSMN